MPDAAPRSKRAVPTKRAPVVKRHVVVAPPDPTPSGRTGFRVPPPVEDEVEEPSTNYALRLTEALEAISSAQQTQPLPLGELNPARSAGDGGASARSQPSPPPSPRGRGGFTFARLGESFAKLPPIRLPFGPAIPWRFGVPVLVLVVVAMIFVTRPTTQAARIPTPEPYPVEQAAPLFTDAQPTAVPAPAPALGVADPGGLGFDVFDLGLKLIAVLALAYGSLLLLKRAGLGGVAAIKVAGKTSGLQVVASLTLAPNRTVHLLKLPGGKTVLVGATPNQVNLIVDLGDLAEDPESEATGSFFDILKGKLPQ